MNRDNLRRGVVAVTVTLLLWVLLSVAAYYGWIRGVDHRDFYPWWAASRLVLLEGQAPYDLETTRQIQITLYGQERPDGIDQQGFAYPVHLIPVLLPFWFISDVEISTAAWEGLSLVMMGWTLLALRDVWGRKIPLWVIVGLLFWFYPVLMVFQAQVIAVPLAAVGLGYWAYLRRFDVAAGLLMSLGAVKPELMFFPLSTMLIFAVLHRRWRVVSTFMIVQIALFVVTLLIAGWWLPEWLNVILGRYPSYAQSVWAIRDIWVIHPLYGLMLVAGVVSSLVWLRRSYTAVVAASIAMGLLLVPQTPFWVLTILLFPLLYAWRGRARWGVAAIWLLGWLLLIGSAVPDWWKVHSTLIPTLTLAVIAVASREHEQPDENSVEQARPALHEPAAL